MKPSENFLKSDPTFWAGVRIVSQDVGYSYKSSIIRPSILQIEESLRTRSISSAINVEKIHEYFLYRADALESFALPNLMNSHEAEHEFNILRNRLGPTCPLPMNRQKNEKRQYAYLTCIVNMLVEEALAGKSCDYDPQSLLSFVRDGIPLSTSSRRFDGAVPSTTNPFLVWEVKEYYHTTSFGSRVADGIYETKLDGHELSEVKCQGVPVHHVLIVDARDCWWRQGKSYLCRLIDTLNMGLVDEIVFGREALVAIPRIVSEVITNRDHHIKMDAENLLR